MKNNQAQEDRQNSTIKNLRFNIKTNQMKALFFNGKLSITKVPIPQRKNNEILIRVLMAGICNTDIEITRGYIPGFKGILGHEFIGIIESADDSSLIGKRCTAEINFSCGKCEYCIKGLKRHCPHRSVLGIINQNGVFAEFVCVPQEHIVFIDDKIPNGKAIFIEPLAAALEILDQVPIAKSSKVLLLGDGKLGTLISFALASMGCNLTIVGKHSTNRSQITGENINRIQLKNFNSSKFDVVIEATGNAKAFEMAVQNTKPKGTLVLKSTYAKGTNYNLSPIVVDEISVIGSRCGNLIDACNFLLKYNFPFKEMISAEFRLGDSIEAFNYAERKGILKVILKIP